MKQILLGLILILSASSFAGTPDQDPLIAQIRSGFAKAHTPDPFTEIGLGESWNCTFRSSLQDDTTTMNVAGAYRLFLMYPLYPSSDLREVGNEGKTTLTEIDYTQSGLAGIVPDPKKIYDGLTEIFRVDSSKTLYVEVVDRGVYDDGHEAVVKPITHMPGPKDAFRAVSYRVCHLASKNILGQ